MLESIAVGNDQIPTLYYSGNVVSGRIFWARLRWIHRLIRRLTDPKGVCLDFGAGGGVFLPTLATCFESVVGIDLHTAEAEQVIEHYRLDNVSLHRGDMNEARLESAPFHAIVAADVLEHFEDLEPPVRRLREWLAADGVLFTSLPSETGFYDWLRRLYGLTKPADHFHTGWEVEAYLEGHGFKRRSRWLVPFGLPFVALYLVSAWSRDD